MLKKIIMGIVMMMLAQSSLHAGTIPTQENVTKLYVATFKRAPDAAGLHYWVNDSGLQLEQVAQSFFDQPETQEKYPSGSTNTEFVIAVYANLFNREPEPAGLAYWVGELDSGRVGKSVFILAVINGAQNTEEFGNDGTILSNKTLVGLAFSDAGMDDVEDAKDIMGGITDNFSTVDTALENYVIDYSIDYVSLLGEKSFYIVEYDYVDSSTFNADVTELSWIEITPDETDPGSGVDPLLIDGEKLFIYEGADVDAYMVLSVENSDYLEFNVFALNGTADGQIRFYLDQTKAVAYYESLQPIYEVTLESLLAGKTVYTTIYDQMGTLESWVFNADMTSVTWTELVGGTDSGTGTLSVDGMIMSTNADTSEPSAIVVTEILTDYMLVSIEGGAEQRVYFDETKARAYFLGNDIIGTWYFGNASQSDNIATLTFFSNGSYVMLEDGDSNDDPSGWDGMERGTYSWNETTGELQADTLTDTNGEWGLSHPISGYTFIVENNVLTITDGEDVYTLNRVVDKLDDIIGTWYFGNASQSDNIATLTFFSNGSYVMLEDGDSNDDPSGWDGMERGTYSWNETTGELQADTLTDTNGEWGLSHPISGYTFIVENNVLTITDGEDVYTLNRNPLEITEEMLIGKTFYNSGTEFTEYDDNTTAYEERYTSYTFSAGELTVREVNDGEGPITLIYSYEIIDGKIRVDSPPYDGDPAMYVWWTLIDQSVDSWTVRDEEDINKDGSVDYTVESTWYLTKPEGYPDFNISPFDLSTYIIGTTQYYINSDGTPASVTYALDGTVNGVDSIGAWDHNELYDVTNNILTNYVNNDDGVEEAVFVHIGTTADGKGEIFDLSIDGIYQGSTILYANAEDRDAALSALAL